jgi:hypothetical protein
MIDNEVDQKDDKEFEFGAPAAKKGRSTNAPDAKQDQAISWDII